MRNLLELPVSGRGLATLLVAAVDLLGEPEHAVGLSKSGRGGLAGPLDHEGSRLWRLAVGDDVSAGPLLGVLLEGTAQLGFAERGGVTLGLSAVLGPRGRSKISH